jgi:hypothetical protein
MLYLLHMFDTVMVKRALDVTPTRTLNLILASLDPIRHEAFQAMNSMTYDTSSSY